MSTSKNLQQRQLYHPKVIELYDQKYTEQRKLSEESCLVQSIKEGQYFISKRINTTQLSNQEIQQLEYQLEQIKKLSHPNIMKLKETIREKDFIIQIIEYAGDQTLKNKLDSQTKPSVAVATQYLFQLLFALDYLDSQQITLQPDYDINSIYLNQYGAIRFSFNMGQQRREWKEEVKRVGDLFGNIIIDENQSHELRQIQIIMMTKSPSPQFMLNHPYLLKAMQDFYRQQINHPEVHTKIKKPPQPIVKSSKEQVIRNIYTKPQTANGLDMNKSPIQIRKNMIRIQSSKEKVTQSSRVIQINHLPPLDNRDNKVQIRISLSQQKQKPREPIINNHKLPFPGNLKNNQNKNQCPKVPMPLQVKKSPSSDSKLLQHRKSNSLHQKIQPDIKESKPHSSSKIIHQIQDFRKSIFDKNQLIIIEKEQIPQFNMSSTLKLKIAKIIDSDDFQQKVKTELNEKNYENYHMKSSESLNNTLEESTGTMYVTESEEDNSEEQLHYQAFNKTSREEELREMLEIYKNQLAESIRINKPFLNMSEIQECSMESSIQSQSIFSHFSVHK